MPLVSAEVWFDDPFHPGLPPMPDRFRRRDSVISHDLTSVTAADFKIDGAGVDVSVYASIWTTKAAEIGFRRPSPPRRWADVSPPEIRLLEPSADVGNAPWSSPSGQTVPRRGYVRAQGVMQEFELGLPPVLIVHLGPTDVAKRMPSGVRVTSQDHAILHPGDLYAKWPDPASLVVYSPIFTGSRSESGTGSLWFGARTVGGRPVAHEQVGALSAPPEVFLGQNIFGVYTHHWQHPLPPVPRRREYGSISDIDRPPDLPEQYIVALAAVEAHRLPVPRPRGPATPPAFLDAGEFFTIVVWDSQVTLPTRGPSVRRGFVDDFPISVFVSIPDVTAHVLADASWQVRSPQRVRQHATYARSLDSDYLGPLPAVFVYSPAVPTRVLPRVPVATDGTLRDLPDANESIIGAWQGQQPQPPTRQLRPVATPSSPVGGTVWFGSIQADELLTWIGPQVQPPTLPLARRLGQIVTGFDSWTPLGEPIGWYAMPQAQTLPRPVAMRSQEYTAAPPIYATGVIIVGGPYYAAATQLYSAGAIAAQVTTE